MYSLNIPTVPLRSWEAFAGCLGGRSIIAMNRETRHIALDDGRIIDLDVRRSPLFQEAEILPLEDDWARIQGQTIGWVEFYDRSSFATGNDNVVGYLVAVWPTGGQSVLLRVTFNDFDPVSPTTLARSIQTASGDWLLSGAKFILQEENKEEGPHA